MSPGKRIQDSDNDSLYEDPLDEDYDPEPASKRLKRENSDYYSSNSTDEKLHRKRKVTTAVKNYISEGNEAYNNQTKTQSSPVKKIAPIKVSSKASVVSLATNAELDEQSATDRLRNVDPAVLGKIKKALTLGGHQGTGEAEAKRAMRLAAKLMAQHNVAQADILAEEKDSEKLKRYGSSQQKLEQKLIHEILCKSWTIHSSRTNGFLQRLLSGAQFQDKALCFIRGHLQLRVRWKFFFDCKSYNESHHNHHSNGTTRIDWIFYGLCEQTVAAAYGFEMVYNLVLMWSAQNKSAKGRSEKNAYCHGVADGLKRLARDEKKEENRLAAQKEAMRLESARAAETEERMQAIRRLVGSDIKIKEEESCELGSVKKETTGSIHLDLGGAEGSNKMWAKKEESMHVKIEEVPDEDALPGLSMLTSQPSEREDRNSDSDDDFTDTSSHTKDQFEVEADFQDRDDGVVDWMQQDLGSASVKQEEEEPATWSSTQQLMLFRNNASSIAENYLNQQKIKLYKRRAGQRPNLKDEQNRMVYDEGCRDAKNIDVKRKRIKDVED
ncbi:hypothetical protein K439DRAFT_1613849 [Ramaria rubella]|nr:hypothetical protein K439DRAFT_1613849 [Ramaria rubella]